MDMCVVNATAYKRIDIWVRVHLIQDEQYPFRDVDLSHAAELEASFLHHSFD